MINDIYGMFWTGFRSRSCIGLGRPRKTVRQESEGLTLAPLAREVSWLLVLLMTCTTTFAQEKSSSSLGDGTTVRQPSIGKAAYDPTSFSNEAKFTVEDAEVSDLKRARKIPVRLFIPENKSPSPVVLFSHGLGGSRAGNRYMGEHLAKCGYVVVVLQHLGSDTSVWKDVSPRERMQAMKKAASADNFFLRVGDVTAVLDKLKAWNEDPTNPLSGRLDMNRIGMSGHSFGAHTTQAVSGQVFPLFQKKNVDSRIRAAIAYSPSSPEVGDPRKAFSQVSIPWMLMTGTEDVAPIGNQDVQKRLAVFDSLPSTIDRYQLVLDKAQHSAFTDIAKQGEQGKRNPNHHRSILALSTAFWDAYLRENQDARDWLLSSAARDILDPADRWDAESGD